MYYWLNENLLLDSRRMASYVTPSGGLRGWYKIAVLWTDFVII